MSRIAARTCFRRSLFSGGLTEFSGRNFIGNSFVESLGKKVYPRHNPVDNKKTGLFADSNPQDAEEAIKAANDAFVLWSKTSCEFRAKLLEKLSDLLAKHIREFSETITSEMGKPISESVIEVKTASSLLSWFSGETKRMHGQIFSVPDKKKMFVTYKPHGVVGLISPWNFPLNMPVRSLGPLLGSGCTCVFKPCPETPLTALLLAKLIREAGFPSGVFNVVTANYESTPPLGSMLATHPLVRHICFTGSTAVGKILLADAANSVKRCTMELGGNAPAIVFNKADIEQTVNNLILAKFRNAGQTCISPNRIFVQDGIYDRFIKSLIDEVSKLRCGRPMEESTQIAGLYDKKGFDKVIALVDAAKKEGAHCPYQGPKVDECGPFFFPPTILSECKPKMNIFNCEIFGPVCPIFRFDSESDVFEQMNKCAHGLAAYVYSTDLSQVFRTIEELNFGLIAVNDVTPSKYYLTFGGHKESGIGTAMGLRSLHNYSDAQSIVLDHE